MSQNSVDAATWMQRCIAHYRDRLAKAPPDLAAEFVRMLDLREPLQFFAFESERFDWQGIVAVHSPLAPDGYAETRRIEPWTAEQAFEDALAHPLWGATLPEPDDEFTVPTREPDPTLRSAGLRTFSYIESIFRLTCLWEPKKPEATGFFQRIHYGCLVLQHRGSMAAFPPEQPVDAAYESAQRNLENRRKWQPDPSPPTVMRPGDVRGAYIVPRLRIGKLVDQSLNNLARLKFDQPGDITHRTTLNGHRVLVTHNGFVAFADIDLAGAVRQLNLVAAAMLELGYPCYVFREMDIAELYVPRDDAGHGWGGRFSGSPRQEPGDDDRTWHQCWLRTSEFDEILTLAAAIANRPYAVHLQNYLEAYTHLAGHEPDQSLLFSWAILERWLHTRSMEYNPTASSETPLKTKLHRLHAAQCIDDDLHARLTSAKKVRNRVMHGEGSATQTEAEDVLAAVELAIAGRRLRGQARPTARSKYLAALATITKT